MPRRHLKRASALLSKHYKLGCSGLQSKQAHFKAHAAYSVQANPAGALIYQKSSAIQSATHRPSQNASISHAPLGSIHSFAAEPYMRPHAPRSQHTRTCVSPYISSSAFHGSRPVHFRPPCFSARPFSQRSHPHTQHPPAISPVPSRVLRRLRAPGSLGLMRQHPAQPRVSESSPLWGLSQLSSRHHSSNHGGWSSRTSPRTSRRAGFADCVRDSHHPEGSQTSRQHGAGMRGRDREDLWGRGRHGGLPEQRMTSFQAGLAELCREQHAQRGTAYRERRQESRALSRLQTAGLAAGLAHLSRHRDAHSSHLARQQLATPRPPPTAHRMVTQSHGGLDRLAYAMHSRSQAAAQSAASSTRPAAPQHAAQRSLDRHRIRQQRNGAALSTLQTIFE
ncbi:hypothetical protein WJX74_007761 [Apatococcus lobatus]|uniref:Uncharacterized protein n=1 Tax=Apatococcus lobatus TaxID=904363 RepID=A0AAW1RMV4_9CHLO